jgi:zinc protease
MPIPTSPLDRTQPPSPGAIQSVSFPPIREESLSNGLRVFIVENHAQPIVNVIMYVRAGSTEDPAQLEGLAAVTSDLLTKGTLTRNALEIAEAIDFVGGSLHAGTSWDATTISIGILTKFLETGLNLLEDVALRPSFPQEELERVKLQRLAAISQAKADAGYLADSLFSRLVFPDHPYGQESSGTEASIEEITTAHIRSFYKDYFGPERSFIVASGDVDPERFLADLESRFGGWSSKSVAKDKYAPEQHLPGTRVALVEKAQAVQSAIRVGHLGIQRNETDFVKLHVLNMLFGGYFNSRINLNLREKHGFTYGARSYFDARMMPGPFVVSTEVSTGVTARAVEEILSEMRRITVEPISAEELEMVKNYVIGSFPLQIETPQQVAARVAAIILYGLPRNYYDTYREIVANLTCEELFAAAKKYLHPNDVTIVVSGNVDAIRSGMEELGPLSVYDMDGKLLASTVAA